MKTLFKLAKYNSEYLKIVEALMSQDKDNPLKKLFSIVFSERILDDNQAMQAIYGKKNLSTFWRLKTRLKEILIKVSLLQNTSLEKEHSRINESMNQFRHTIVSKFLMQLKNNDLAIEIAERALIKSMKYGLTENVILLLRILIRHYSSTEYDKRRLKNYLIIQKKYLYMHNLEIKAENYYFDLQQSQLQSLATPNEETIEKAKKYVEELENVKNVETFSFLLNRYKVKAAYFEYIKDYNSILKLSEDTLKEFNVPELKADSAITSINIRRTWALVQAGRNDETITIGLKEMIKLSLGSPAWYFISHYVLKAYMYKGAYNHAIDLIKKMIENTKFKNLGSSHRELFQTTLGYVHLIVDSGLAGDPKKLKKNLPEFKIGKFLNTTPVFSKDKRGINVSILLMHIAILLQRKNYNAIIDRIDSLNQYAYRYLRKDDTFRSNCMIKMVVQMTKADFNPIRTERYTRDLLKQLEQVKLAGSGENIETEIIPYEVLWSIMLKAL